MVLLLLLFGSYSKSIYCVITVTGIDAYVSVGITFVICTFYTSIVMK